jgi:hypothetical protein
MPKIDRIRLYHYSLTALCLVNAVILGALVFAWIKGAATYSLILPALGYVPPFTLLPVLGIPAWIAGVLNLALCIGLLIRQAKVHGRDAQKQRRRQRRQAPGAANGGAGN